MNDVTSKVNHQKQPTYNSCASAALAMALDIDVDTVVDEFHDGYINGDKFISDYLDQKGISYTICRPEFWVSKDAAVGIYLAAVPSLQSKAEMHSIIIEKIDATHWTVHDPLMEVDDYEYYTACPNLAMLENNAVLMKSYFVKYFIEG